MGRIVLDLHPIFNSGKDINEELGRVIREAVQYRISEIEIIPGKGTGQLRRRVIRFLHLPHIKHLYHRIKIDPDNHGKMYVYFKHEDPYAR